MLLTVSQYLQENTCGGVYLFDKVKGLRKNFHNNFLITLGHSLTTIKWTWKDFPQVCNLTRPSLQLGTEE